MPYTYESPVSETRMHVTRCEEGLHLLAEAGRAEPSIPVCVKFRDVPKVLGEMACWAQVPDYAAAWQALKDHLATSIEADETVRQGMVRDGETELAAPFGGLVSASRSTLAKMRELEAGNG